MKPTFEMIKNEYGGVEMTYTTSGGKQSSTYFPSPPEDIDHVCINYMKGRFGNVRTWKQVDFIKRKYKEAYQMAFGVVDELKIGDKVVMHTCGKRITITVKFGLVGRINSNQVVARKWCF